MAVNGAGRMYRGWGIKAPSATLLGACAVWAAVILYASSNSIVTLLVDIGRDNPVAGGRNAITYTNLYVLGSLISLGPLALLYRRDLTRGNLRRMTRRHWALLVVSAVLSSVLTPGLFFYALEHTTVTNVVLVGRIEPPLFLLATCFFLRERLNRWAMLAGLIALAGAMVILGSGAEGILRFGTGELAAVAATLSFIASTIVTRAGLRDVPLGIFAIFRTLIGAGLYVTLVSVLSGPDQFRDLAQPVIWKWVWIYAFIVIVLGQVAWNFGLKHARAGDLSLATSFSPLAAIIIAMMLLGEDPGPGLIPGAVLILIAIGIGNLRLPEPTTGRLPAAPRSAHVPVAPSHPGPLQFTSLRIFAQNPGTNPCSQSFSQVHQQRDIAKSTPETENMEKKMGKLLATAAMGIALSVPTFAFSGETKNETEQAAAETEQAVKEAEQTSEQAAAEVEQSAEEIVNEADQAASEAVEETEQAVNEAEQTAGEAVEETEQAAAEAEEGDGPGSDAVAADAEDAMVEGYAMVDASKMTAEELDGAAVYDTADEWIGEVSEIVLADDGKIETIVVDVGGFLGIGEKPVGLDYEKIKVLRGEDGGDLRVHVKSSKEELESMQEYEG